MAEYKASQMRVFVRNINTLIRQRSKCQLSQAAFLPLSPYLALCHSEAEIRQLDKTPSQQIPFLNPHMCITGARYAFFSHH